MAIIVAYKTGAYSQREIGENYQLYPTNDGWVTLRKNKNSWFWPSSLFPPYPDPYFCELFVLVMQCLG